MAEQVTIRELIAHRPLVYAWVWEMLCLAAGIYVILTGGNEMIFIGLVMLGAGPFAFVLLRFLSAHKRGETGSKPGSIVE